TFTAPVPVSCTPLLTSAVLLPWTQFTDAPAATPTPPPSSPELLLALPFPVDAWSFALGMLPFVFPLAFGFWLTWWLDWSSAFFPPSPELFSPAALAITSTPFLAFVVAPTVIAPAVRLRDTSPFTVVVPALMPTAAPTATLPPAAAASVLTSDEKSSVAWMVALPLTVRSLPLPRCADVVSPAITSETAGARATPPSLPALSSVETAWRAS